MNYMERSKADWYIRRYKEKYCRAASVHSAKIEAPIDIDTYNVRELPSDHIWVNTADNSVILMECQECLQRVYLTRLLERDALSWCYHPKYAYGFVSGEGLEECSLVRMRKALL